MRLETLSFCNHVSGWTLSEMKFYPDLTLLVGISGVGKTRIIESVRTLKAISEADEDWAFWGLRWSVKFSTEDHRLYEWKGEFEHQQPSQKDDEWEELGVFYWRRNERVPRPKITSESLLIDGEKLFERSEERVTFRGKSTPKLSPYESVLKILNQEDGVKSAHSAFGQLLFVDHSESDGVIRGHVSDFDKLCAELSDIDKIRSADLQTKVKLGILHAVAPRDFELLVDRFREVFPQVQEMQVRVIKGSPGYEFVSLRMKECGVDAWIPESRMSSGMMRTFMHLSRMLLWPDGTVVLIDEFENSLGVNCIDYVTNDLMDESRRLQFVITSHHPYIINNIGTKNWKIVSRQGSVVSTRNAQELGLDVSRHEAFIKLMNLDEYNAGIETG